MTQLNEAIARYHRILESDEYKDLTWVDSLQGRMRAHHLVGSQRVSPYFVRISSLSGSIPAL